ncbi:TolB family protein [Lihuaxuella thermophila]|uniref:WD40-like Beta Propeller Repeat n=1 Tax=Lihuaxuella thermophila TaxID=1173111 RepID=A0A1H8IC32_9BACL|nr:PD40 domain-containing protein [Lihuaxuella thermophila]SEN66004.1 WD40-like Beta Propeller Repeat [Lihuaxuella thermophila]
MIRWKAAMGALAIIFSLSLPPFTYASADASTRGSGLDRAGFNAIVEWNRESLSRIVRWHRQFVNSIVYAKWDEGYNIYISKPDGTDEKQLTNRYGEYAVEPRIHPMGMKVMYRIERDLYIVNILTGEEKLIPYQSDEVENNASWTKDGKILYDNGTDIFLMEEDGSNRVNLTDRYEGRATHATLSPDGSKLAFENWGHVYVMDMNTKEVKQIYTGGRDPEFSPIGNRLVVTLDSYYEGAVITMDADGQNVQKISVGNLINLSDPTWSPDGKRIAFNAPYNVYTINSDGTNLQKITNQTSYVGNWSRAMIR